MGFHVGAGHDRRDAAKADVAHAGVDHLRSPRGGSIAAAVTVGAQERSALDHLARHPELRLVRVVAARLAARIAGAGVGVPVAGPLPDVARHIEQAVAVGWKAADGVVRPYPGSGRHGKSPCQ